MKLFVAIVYEINSWQIQLSNHRLLRKNILYYYKLKKKTTI